MPKDVIIAQWCYHWANVSPRLQFYLSHFVLCMQTCNYVMIDNCRLLNSNKPVQLIYYQRKKIVNNLKHFIYKINVAELKIIDCKLGNNVGRNKMSIGRNTSFLKEMMDGLARWGVRRVNYWRSVLGCVSQTS